MGSLSTSEARRHLHVVAAIIHRDGRILATQRGYGPMKDGWEFPGGKIENGETAEQALHREIKEELDVEIAVERLFDTVEWDYPDFHLTMYCFLCTLMGDDVTLMEHESSRWLSADELNSVGWLPADRDVVEKLAGFAAEGCL